MTCNCDYCVGGRDKRYGLINADDGWEETPHRKAGKTKARKRVPGCPENDGGPHVYVWTTEGMQKGLFFEYFGFHRAEHKICAGCRKGAPYRSGATRRPTERYVKKFKPVGRYCRPEYEHEGYRAFRNQYIDRHGWPSYLYY